MAVDRSGLVFFSLPLLLSASFDAPLCAGFRSKKARDEGSRRMLRRTQEDGGIARAERCSERRKCPMVTEQARFVAPRFLVVVRPLVVDEVRSSEQRRNLPTQSSELFLSAFATLSASFSLSLLRLFVRPV